MQDLRGLAVVESADEAPLVDENGPLAGVPFVVEVDRPPTAGVGPVVDDRERFRTHGLSKDRLEVGTVSDELVRFGAVAERFVSERPRYPGVIG